MTVFLTAVLPTALVAIVGIAIGRCFKLDVSTLAQVNLYAMLPALVLTSLLDLQITAGRAVLMIAAFLINTGLLYLISLGLGYTLRISPDQRKSLMATTLFANVGNMGLPFILFSLGEAGLERAVIYLVISSLLISSLFPIILQGTGLRASAQYSLKLPVLWAALLGVGIQITPWDLPNALSQGLQLLGEGVVPLALLTLGIQLARSRFALGALEWIGAGLRLGVSPSLAYAIGRGLGLTGLDLQVLVLQAAMPVAVSSLIWVTELGGDASQVSRTIVLSTLLSFVTLPLLLHWGMG